MQVNGGGGDLKVGSLRIGGTMADGRLKCQRLHVRSRSRFYANGNLDHSRNVQDDRARMEGRHVLSRRILRERRRPQSGAVPLQRAGQSTKNKYDPLIYN